MFGFGKKKNEKDKSNGKVHQTQTLHATQEITTHSSFTSSYKETTKVTRTTVGVVSLNSSLDQLKLESSNSNHSSILNKLQSTDLQPLKRSSVPSISTSSYTSKFSSPSSSDAMLYKQPSPSRPPVSYRSVYTREPFSSYQPATKLRSSTSVQSSSSLSRPPLPPLPPTPSSTNSVILPNPSYVDKTLKVKVVKTGKKYDEGESKVPIYKTSSKNKGRVLVINNVKFLNEKQHRQGAEIDEKNITELFKQMGMKVVNHRDKKKVEMQKIIEKYTKESTLKQVDINIVVIMSHGTGRERHDSTEVVGTDDELLPTTWILEQFTKDNCPYLNNKPKIFIFQCCRGNNKDISSTMQHDAVPFVPPSARKFADMLIAYSTVPGFVSHRDPQTGTWYIQTICEVFMNHAHDTDVESMLKMVDHQLEKIVNAFRTRQTTSFENRGFKTCYLHPV